MSIAVEITFTRVLKQFYLKGWDNYKEELNGEKMKQEANATRKEKDSDSNALSLALMPILHASLTPLCTLSKDYEVRIADLEDQKDELKKMCDDAQTEKLELDKKIKGTQKEFEKLKDSKEKLEAHFTDQMTTQIAKMQSEFEDSLNVRV